MSTEKNPKPSDQSQVIEFKLINLDPLIVQGFQSNHSNQQKICIANNIQFIPAGLPHKDVSKSGLKGTPSKKKEELFLLKNNYNLRLKDLFLKATKSRPRYRAGLLKFQDIQSYGTNGLLISKSEKCIYYGHLIGWPLKALKNSLNNLKEVKTWLEDETVIMILGKSQSQFKKGILMKSRGEQIYGHWLVDYIPRLHLIGLAKRPSNAPLIFNQLPNWSLLFIEKVLPSSQEVIEDNSKLISIKQCVVPCYTKIGHSFLSDISKSAWTSLRKFFEISNKIISTTKDEENLPKKLFISREEVSTSDNRKIHNIEKIQRISEENGYKTIHPEKLSLFEQAKLFNHAEFIIGEDGSALHSIIFSRKKIRLIVLMSPNRMNLWHAGICEILDHQISYMEALKIDGQSLIDEKSFRDDLNTIENI